MTDIGKHIQTKINECIRTMHPKFIHQSPNKLTLYMPKIAIENLINYYNASMNIRHIGDTLKYNGFNIVQGYEMAIILAHEDAAIFGDECISRVNLLI